MVYTDRQWLTFFDLIGRSDLAGDPHFQTIRDRTEHIDELYQLLESVLTTRSTEQWLDQFDKADIPAVAVKSLAELVDDPQIVASELFETVDHPTEGCLRQPGLAWKFSRTPSAPGRSSGPAGRAHG
ncbi:CoA transferase [Leekyejoonella antrihumi]|uniref:CoA transferase n=1 Tax=Leekyejoonella antrihumi TaxID=1660198 RepID=A0A563DWK3_9MICO|nr:CoA transferase [Leekyejoonella antrihumi]TWP34585.1 hypothetical protein FGL98_16960 [Leekyejoonella antrihumi]